jgi:hypothetical protein
MTYLRDIRLENWIDVSKYENFVETGCWLGEGIEEAYRLGLKKIYSCDLCSDFAIHCMKKHPDAKIFVSDSVLFLKQLLYEISGRTIFWLDAHFPETYGLTVDKECRFPLLYELDIIEHVKKDYCNDIIIIDDLHCFQDEFNPVRNVGIEPYHSVSGVSFKDEIVDRFSNTHVFQLIQMDQGVGIYIPKGDLV